MSDGLPLFWWIPQGWYSFFALDRFFLGGRYASASTLHRNAYDAQQLRWLPIHQQTGMDSAAPMLFVPVPDFRNGSVFAVKRKPAAAHDDAAVHEAKIGQVRSYAEDSCKLRVVDKAAIRGIQGSGRI